MLILKLDNNYGIESNGNEYIGDELSKLTDKKLEIEKDIEIDKCENVKTFKVQSIEDFVL